jgi:flagellar hook-associated protein 2
LIALDRRPIALLEKRAQTLLTETSALKTLEANLLSLSTASQQLQDKAVFDSFAVSNSSKTSLSITTNDDVVEATYQFQSIRKVASHVARSQGFGDPAEQTLGVGSINIISGGLLNNPTKLGALNGGNGIQHGELQIADRSGATDNIDLSNAYTIDDVVNQINDSDDISVVASTSGGRLVLTDVSGSTDFDLIVSEIDGGQTAGDLGIAGSVAGNVLTGNDVLSLNEGFALDQINDGNAPLFFEGAPDVRITLSDDTVLEVTLDEISTLGQLIDGINNHEDNGGKVLASLVDGHLELDDQSGGGGAGVFSIEDINGASVVRQVGLESAAVGTQITGRNLLGGLNSVLLANLRGGQGIDQTGQVSLTDRTGLSATIDLTSANSLDEVIEAINSAKSGGMDLQLTARINDIGTGILITDTSGASVSNLIIADVGGSTLATQLGIAVDSPADSINSGSLSLRFANESTDINDYLPQSDGISTGSFVITDSAGDQATIVISDSVKTIGDVMLRINAASDIAVRAELNETGDGFVLIDDAGGSGTLKVEDLGDTIASELRLLGDSVVGSDGKQHVFSRLTTVIDVAADDTLDEIVQRINDAGGNVTASLIDDGSAFNSTRLVLPAADEGESGRFVLDDGGLGISLTTLTEGQDALLRVGPDAQTGFLIRSDSNVFEGAAKGVDVEILAASTSGGTVTVSRDSNQIKSALQSFVAGFNSFAGAAAEATVFDFEGNRRGILQGSGVVLRASGRLRSLVNRRFLGTTDTIRSLGDLGIRFGKNSKIVFDTDRFDAAIEADPQAVADFFLTASNGFSAVLETTLDSFTDPFTGTFALAENALQASVDSLEERATLLDELLLTKRDRLLQEFILLEQTLGQLTFQQQALGGISSLSVRPVGKGIF